MESATRDARSGTAHQGHYARSTGSGDGGRAPLMDETAALAWLHTALGVSRETVEKLSFLIELLKQEAKTQNLVSMATLNSPLSRHIVDSAQLITLCKTATDWLDLGSGAGFPGLILSILTGRPVVLVESRKLRAEWLVRAAAALDLRNVRVEQTRVEQLLPFPAGAITARAFAPLRRLLPIAYGFSSPMTHWVLPKGRSASEELASIADTWHGLFSLVPSVTDPSSAIILARDVRPKR